MNYDVNDVMNYFYEISAIPRMSGKEKKIADYIVKFADERNLKFIRDEYDNVIITKESKQKSSRETVILQCHLDMVCEKEENCIHDFEKEGLELYIEDGFIKAKGTTLGADNGIGVAIILAILNSDKIEHPRIEAIFTVQEETTMQGAKEIDTSILQGRKMICLDNMSEEELVIGCAGAKIFDYEIYGENIKNLNEEDCLVRIGLHGFRGGHSGKDIYKGRGNPIEELAMFLENLNKKYGILIKNIYGGRKVNVIPRECFCELYISREHISELKQEIDDYNKFLKEKIQISENIMVDMEIIQSDNNECYNSITTSKLINIVKDIPNGVYYSDKYNNPLISLNIGKIKSENNKINLQFSTRFNKKIIEEELEKKLNEIAERYKIEVTTNELVGYEHKNNSSFIDNCKEIYIQYFGKKPKVISKHVCLEAGFFGSKIKKLDFVAIAPYIFDAHSPKERCSIKSIERIYNYINLILSNEGIFE